MAATVATTAIATLTLGLGRLARLPWLTLTGLIASLSSLTRLALLALLAWLSLLPSCLCKLPLTLTLARLAILAFTRTGLLLAGFSGAVLTRL